MPLPPLPKGATPIDDDQMPPLPKGAVEMPTVTPTTGASISAAKPEGWLDQVHDDLLHGGNRTIVGRVLGHMEGNGDKGYKGLESGASPAAAQYMGSLPLGAVKMAKGAVDAVQGHPWKSVKDTVGGELQAATIPLAMMGGPESEAAMARIPNASRAGQILSDIEREARNVPVYMDNTSPALERFGEHVQTGGKNAKVMSMLRRRIERAGTFAKTPKAAPRVAGFFRPPDIPLGDTPAPGKMPGGLVDAERFPAENVGEARVIRNSKGQILPKAAREVEFPESKPPARISPIRNERGVFVSSEGMNPEGPGEKPMLPIGRNPNNGQMLARTPTRRAFMAGDGEEVFPHQEFSGPGVFRPSLPVEGSPLDEFGRVTFDAPRFQMAAPDGEPIYFPEARKFYTNVTDVAKRPGFLKRALESSRNPRMRRVAGDVKEGLNSDLRNAANSIGRGEDYVGAMREYRNAMRLRTAMRRLGYIGAAEAARRTGLLGHAAHDLTLGH